jgi:phosphate starvation-inducible PhoH-like protein
VRERYGVRISLRRDTLLVEGEDDEAVREVSRRVRDVIERVRSGEDLSTEAVEGALLDGAGGAPERAAPPDRTLRAVPGAGGSAWKGAHAPRPSGRAPGPRSGALEEARPRTKMQEQYIRAIRTHDVVIAIGPAGTGKTFLAVVEAVISLRSGATRRIILTRPAVEAGEKLGFLPGDFQAKINPYLRPLYDALGELLPFGEMQRYVAADVIEIVPLAYMRGRTLKDAFIILDEAQNTTPAQMKMFLTRLGQGSKVVVTGDITQVDLPDGTPSGLIQSIGILDGVRGIEVIRFGAGDILRHPLVQRIVDAYERHGTGKRAGAPDAPADGPDREGQDA